MKNFKLIVILLFSVVFTNCDQVKLSENDAKNLVEQSLNIPKEFSVSISSSDASTLQVLLNDGVITDGKVDHSDNRKNYIVISEACKQYNLGQTQNMGHSEYLFKTYDIELEKINGISINKENQTAIVRFSLKITNITPFARSIVKANNWYVPIYKNLDDTINGELSFRKFDNGWQIETSHEGYDSLLKKVMEEHRKNS